jgi:hypothetical protein
VFFKRKSEKELDLVRKFPLQLKSQQGSFATYTCDIQPQNAGVFEYGFRIFPQHPLLAHRQDFDLVRWI